MRQAAEGPCPLEAAQEGEIRCSAIQLLGSKWNRIVLVVLGSWILAWPLIQQGASSDVLAPAVSLRSRLVGQAAIAEVGRNGRAVAAFDARTGALQPRQPSIEALIPAGGLASNGAKRDGYRD